MGWIDVVQDSDHWRAVMNTARSLWFPQNSGKFLSVSKTVGSSFTGINN
jgi:hypothetical protein